MISSLSLTISPFARKMEGIMQANRPLRFSGTRRFPHTVQLFPPQRHLNEQKWMT
jgi:hypothetical protein